MFVEPYPLLFTLRGVGVVGESRYMAQIADGGVMFSVSFFTYVLLLYSRERPSVYIIENAKLSTTV